MTRRAQPATVQVYEEIRPLHVDSRGARGTPIQTAPTPEESMLLYISATTQVVSAALVVEREELGRSQKV
jgi:hypothetical protein